MLSVEEMKKRLMHNQTPRRYEHALRTADAARDIAARFGLNEQKAYIAGLLHDCAKDEISCGARMLALAREMGITASAAQRAQPIGLLHAQVSAYMARTAYGVEDEEILGAIARHQAGAVGMTPLDKAVSMADATEPMREGKEKYRELLLTDLDEAFYQAFVDTMIKIMQGGFLLEEGKGAVYNALVLDRQARTAIGI